MLHYIPFAAPEFCVHQKAGHVEIRFEFLDMLLYLFITSFAPQLWICAREKLLHLHAPRVNCRS